MTESTATVIICRGSALNPIDVSGPLERTVRHLFTLILISILNLVTIGCDDGRQSATSGEPSAASPKSQQPREAQTLTIPDDVSYSIINSSTLAGIKHSLDVRLNKKVSEETLRSLALKLKSQDARNYERIFICYYLPDMKVGAGAWATTHFDPDLEVRILGLTAKQEEALKQQPDDPSREIIGSWIDDRMHFGHRVTIFRQDGKLFMENTFNDGSSGKKEIVAKPSASGKKFVENKEENRSGEFYLIDSRGDLQLWDQDGLISTARKIGG